MHSLSLTEYEEKVASGIGHPELQHQHAMRAQKRQKFVDCLTADNVDMNVLRKLAWSGIPDELRPISWMVLLVCCVAVLSCKRTNPFSGISTSFCSHTQNGPTKET